MTFIMVLEVLSVATELVMPYYLLCNLLVAAWHLADGVNSVMTALEVEAADMNRPPTKCEVPDAVPYLGWQFQERRVGSVCLVA